MSTWAALFTSLAGPLVKKALTALGMGVVTFVAFNSVKALVDSYVSSGLSGLPSSVYQIVALMGLVDAVGVWLGALTAAATFAAVGRISVLQG